MACRLPKANMCRGEGRKAAGLLLLALVVLVAGFPGEAASTHSPPVAAEMPAVDEIVARVRNAAKGPEGRFTFRQEITLRWMFSTWDFYSEVAANGDQYDVRTYEAPSFVPQELSGALIHVGEELDRFNVRIDGVEELDDGTLAYVLSGERRPEYTSGALSGRIWVRSDTWLIERLEIHYPWGHLDIRQSHQMIRGYFFPRRQEVTASPLGATMDIRYGWFWFDDFLKPSFRVKEAEER